MLNSETDRWLTGSKDGSILAALTPTEATTLDAILNFARSPANRDIELLHCLDGAGDRVIDTTKGNKEGSLSEKMKSAAKAGPVRLWHNHPTQDSLSDKDWSAASASAAIEVVAINISGSLFVGRMQKWRDKYRALFEEHFVFIAGHVKFAIQNSAKKTGMASNELTVFERRVGHVLNLALFQLGVVQYAYCLSTDDLENFQIADDLGVVAAGIECAKREIAAVLR